MAASINPFQVEPAISNGEYGQVKRQLEVVAANIDAHGQGKAPIVRKILTIAGLTASELDSITGNRVPSYDTLPR